jgi:hypothetical protein
VPGTRCQEERCQEIPYVKYLVDKDIRAANRDHEQKSDRQKGSQADRKKSGNRQVADSQKVDRLHASSQKTNRRQEERKNGRGLLRDMNLWE